MKTKQLDVVFINADSSSAAYQDLAKLFTAIEPPTWSLLLAKSVQSKGFGAAIIDATAEQLTHQQAAQRIKDMNPRLVVFVVYGQNPNSGTTNMIGNTACAAILKNLSPAIPICFVGSHTSALPLEVLNLPQVDIVLLNEGAYALHNLLASNINEEAMPHIKGIGYKREGTAVLNAPEIPVPTERMDIDLPGYAWDLLPYNKTPLDLYRAHFWHAGFNHSKRTPFAAIYTSLGCRFKCDFCMINIVNRTNNAYGTASSASANMRFWSPELILREVKILADMGVETLRISDEMFFLNQRYFEPLLNGIIQQDLKLNMWAYSRVDTVREKFIEKFLKSGISWLALGIEAGNQNVRQEVSKGSFKDVNIREVVGSTRAAGMNVISNYIFGFPEDTLESMQQTLDLALELNTETANMYPCQALPGSPLYYRAKQEGWELPNNYGGYAFLSYDSQPLPTKTLSAAQVLQFRDAAWQQYFTNPDYLALIEKKFGITERENVIDMTKIQLKRKLIEEAK